MDDNESALLETFLEDQYSNLKNMTNGKVADYIPQLAKNSPDSFAISVCTVDGKLFNIGDFKTHFSIQSCSKPFMYCYARLLHGLEKVHSHVGYEPSGASFNAFVLNSDLLPHNPMINAGAMMVTSLLNTKEEPSKRFDKVLRIINKIAGIDNESNNSNDTENTILFDNSVYLSERHHADRNISLAYYMRGSGAYGDIKPTPSEIQDSLDLYFQTCSVEINTSIGCRMAGTLANGGINPITGEQIFDTNTTRDCLSLMYSCGMYDYSGQFAFDVGLPAKSGVAGCVMLVVPGKFGMCIWSPPLDEVGNSVRGVELCRRLSKSGPGDYHMFRHVGQSKVADTNVDVAFALMMNQVVCGNYSEVKRYLESTDVNKADYDGRTALHIACAEGQEQIVRLLMEKGAHLHLRDRWGNTALDDLNDLIRTNKSTIDEENLDREFNQFEKILTYIDEYCESHPEVRKADLAFNTSKDSLNSLDRSLSKKRSY